MEYMTKEMDVDAFKFEEGAEDGFIENLNENDEWEMTPFIDTTSGRVGVDENTWIVIFPNGMVNVFSEEDFESMFQKKV